MGERGQFLIERVVLNASRYGAASSRSSRSAELRVGIGRYQMRDPS